MRKRYKNLLSRPIIRFGCIPVLLFLVAIGVSFHYLIVSSNNGIFVLYDYLGKKKIAGYQTHQLHKGDSITLQVPASRKDLGIVYIRFQQAQSLPARQEDIIRFSIKEHGSKTWYFHHDFRSDSIAAMPLFPFGFPVIQNSQSKLYDVQILSLKGNKHNGLSLNPDHPSVILMYKFSKAEIVPNKKQFMLFIFEKIDNALQLPSTLLIVSINFLPFFCYLFWLFDLKRYTVVPALDLINKHLEETHGMTTRSVMTILLLSIKYMLTDFFYFSTVFLFLLDVFFLQGVNDILYSVILFLWIFLFNTYKHKDRVALILSLGLLSIAYMSSFTPFTMLSQKAAIWAYLFLIICVVRAFSMKKQ